MAKSRIWGAETPELITTKFCMPGAIQDEITHANFGEDRFRGFGVLRGRILAFSVDLLRRASVRVCDYIFVTLAYVLCIFLINYIEKTAYSLSNVV